MSYSCKILLDSISETGKRLTTFEITFPRIVLAEFNTHRMFSRNSASSRAIPFLNQLRKVKDHPFIPEQFPLNCTGMQPQEYVNSNDPAYKYYVDYWLGARNNAVAQAEEFYTLKNPHKQILNRLLEPFMWHTVIVTATEFDNFFKLRCDENAQYEIRRIADLMYEAYHYFDNFSPLEGDIRSIDEETAKYINKKTSEREWSAIRPQKLKVGEWHCPLVYEEDNNLIEYYIWSTKGQSLSQDNLTKIRKQISVARCARVSYLTHDGKRDIEKDLELFERLRTSGHWSPFEHVATPFIFNQEHFENELLMAGRPIRKMQMADDFDPNLRSGNFIGWKQFRKEFADENCISFRKEN